MTVLVLLELGKWHFSSRSEEGSEVRAYAALRDKVDFHPVDLETLGAFGPSAKVLLDEIGSHIQSRSCRAGERARLYRRIAAEIQIGNAAGILEAHSRPH